MKNISIIVPVYNAEKTIERTLASFISNKDYIKEVILVNDRSTDNTFDKIENFKSFFDIKIIDNAGEQGPGPGRKTGLLAATGEWVTFVDADDCLTANSLHYTMQHLNKSALVLLHTQSIYYEMGKFNNEIHFDDLSCGGNFYRRQYLIDNNLFPHDSLYMSEDEYFNELIINYITICDMEDSNDLIARFEYPVYEVHHDDNTSFALGNWVDYIYHYHIIYKKYMIQYFQEHAPHALAELKIDFIKHIIFTYFLIVGLDQDDNLVFQKSLQEFYDEVLFFEQVFHGTKKELIDYYYSHKQVISSLQGGASISLGFEIDNKDNSFIDVLNKTCNFKKFLI
jgi:glycosyltransferase involved in cell wall biosynthesis